VVQHFCGQFSSVNAISSIADEDEVDARPGDSPLWGRYLDCLRQLRARADSTSTDGTSLRVSGHASNPARARFATTFGPVGDPDSGIVRCTTRGHGPARLSPADQRHTPCISRDSFHSGVIGQDQAVGEGIDSERLCERSPF